jgi:hypothetical protein
MKIDKYDLSNKYIHDVKVVSTNGFTCYGKLSLNPECIELDIIHESTTLRCPQFNISNTVISCNDGSSQYILVGLKHLTSKHTTLDYQQNVSFITLKFEVNCVLRWSGHAAKAKGVYGLNVISQELIDWIGSTTTQDALLRNPNDDTLREFEWQAIKSVENSFIPYNVLVAYSKHRTYGKQLSATDRLIPQVLFQFPEINLENLPNKIHEIMSFLSFLIGKSISQAELRVQLSGSLSNSAQLYIKTNAHHGVSRASDGAFIPLGMNLRFPAPLSSSICEEPFWNYFQNIEDIGRLTRDYIRFRDFAISEERFIGMFRILERLTFKVSTYFEPKILNDEIVEFCKSSKIPGTKRHIVDFTKRVKKLNEQKGNAESSIGEFLKIFTPDMRRIAQINNIDISEIVRLRNDIAHGKLINSSEEDFNRLSYLCQSLACGSLMHKLGFSLKTICTSIFKINNYRRIIISRSQSEIDAIFCDC